MSESDYVGVSVFPIGTHQASDYRSSHDSVESLVTRSGSTQSYSEKRLQSMSVVREVSPKEFENRVLRANGPVLVGSYYTSSGP